MLYARHITVTANTAEATLERTQFKVSKGFIYRAWINFPAGCAGLVKLRILHEGHPILPINKDAYINFDNYIFEVPLYFELKDEPYLITVEAWNEDEVYNHTIDLNLLVLPRAFVLPVGAGEGLIQALHSLIIKRSGE